MPKNKRPMTAEEIRQKKRECERKRRARIKADPVLYAASKKKDNERYAQKRCKKQVKTVNEMTPRERRIQQRAWRERKARSRSNKKREEQLLQKLKENTPETSADEENRASPTHKVFELALSSPTSSFSSGSIGNRILRSSPATNEESPSVSRLSSSLCRQKLTGLQVARKRRDKDSYQINNQKSLIIRMKKKIHALRVKLLRANCKIQKFNESPRNISSTQIVTKRIKKLHAAVVNFLQRDDNSKLCPGKRDVITNHKMKKQKRYLSDTLSNLHKKFKSECNVQISLSTFCRLRPFWVVSRQVSERDTCLCVTHENMQLKFENLKYLGILNSANLTELCKSVVCDSTEEACMLRQCFVCINKSPDIKPFDGDDNTTYKMWCTVKESRIIKGKEKEIKRTVKQEKMVTKKELVVSFLEDLNIFLQHQYYIMHQYKNITFIKDNLGAAEIFMQIDFSQNYNCKYTNEIQSVHFGASRQQVSLHTGVYYYRCPNTQEVKSRSFCTMSDNLRHDASAVCAHLQEILNQIVLPHEIHTLHILSDGPSAQYKNRYMFYLFTQYLAKKSNCKTATWNFSVAGHGKGPMDGVGAVIKRTADRIVAQGTDVPDFKTLVKCVRENTTNIIISTVTTMQIENISNILPRSINSVSGITKVHQMTWDSKDPRKIYLRKLTCVKCPPSTRCPHMSLSKSCFYFEEHINEKQHVEIEDENENEKCMQNEEEMCVFGHSNKGDHKNKYINFWEDEDEELF